MRLLLPLLSLAILALSGGLLPADEASDHADNRLRDALRNTMMQLRDAQNQVATAQAQQATSDQANAELKAKLDTLTQQLAAVTKQSADDKAASDQAIADLKTKVTDLTGQVQRYADAVSQWKTAYAGVVQQSQQREAARVQLAGQVIVLQRMVDDRERENLDLFKTGNEILDRYDKFSMGDVLLAKEPFVGVARVHMQNEIQDYKDKLLDAKDRMGQVNPTPTVPPPAGAAKAAPKKTADSSSAKPAVRAE